MKKSIILLILIITMVYKINSSDTPFSVQPKIKELKTTKYTQVATKSKTIPKSASEGSQQEVKEIIIESSDDFEWNNEIVECNITADKFGTCLNQEEFDQNLMSESMMFLLKKRTSDESFNFEKYLTSVVVEECVTKRSNCSDPQSAKFIKEAQFGELKIADTEFIPSEGLYRQHGHLFMKMDGVTYTIKDDKILYYMGSANQHSLFLEKELSDQIN